MFRSDAGHVDAVECNWNRFRDCRVASVRSNGKIARHGDGLCGTRTIRAMPVSALVCVSVSVRRLPRESGVQPVLLFGQRAFSTHYADSVH